MERTRDEVRIPSPATAELVAHTLREVIKFLLFVRQQLPCSYDDLKGGLVESLGAEVLGEGEGRGAGRVWRMAHPAWRGGADVQAGSDRRAIEPPRHAFQ